MKRPFWIAALAATAIAPLPALAGGVSVSVSTPEFGFRIGAPVFHGTPVFVPPPVFVPAPVVIAPVGAPVFHPMPVYLPTPVHVRRPVIVAPRVAYPAPVIFVPRRVFAPRVVVPPPRVVVPRHGRYRDDDGDDHRWQRASHRVPPGHARHGMMVAQGKGRVD